MTEKTFYGSGKTKDEYALIELTKIPKELREEEAFLTTTRWFDYGRMAPSEATYLFVHTYNLVSQEFYSKTMDYRKSEDSPQIAGDVFESPEKIDVWLARQSADRIGCRYSFYIREIFDRVFDRCWHKPPPIDYLHAEEVVLDIEDQWNEMKGVHLQEPQSSFYHSSEYVSHPRQNAYLDHLTQFVNGREQSHLTLESLIRREVIPVDQLRARFSKPLLRRALRAIVGHH